MKKIIKISVPVVIILVLCYHLFKPIIIHNFGKEKLEGFKHLQLNINHSNQIKKQADSLLLSEFNKLKTPALSASIGLNNTNIWSNTIGYADVQNKIIADSLTIFRIGSTSKALTSVGLGILIQNKKLETQSLVGDYVPYASNKLSKLTLQQIASHTSGIRNYGTCYCFPIWEYYDNHEYTSIEESVAVFNNDDLLFEPSSSFSYSSYNYTLLSAMMETASEKKFLPFMQENVFQPLQMTQTKADRKNNNRKDVAKFYEIENGEIKESYEVNNSVKWAGGGFLSTTNDLVKLGNAVLNYRVLDSLTTVKLFEPVRLRSGQINGDNYGMGWRNDMKKNIHKDGHDVNIIHHGGVAMGSTAMLILVPEYNLTVAVTMNRNASSKETKNLFFSLPHKLASLFFNSN
ncbi:serine hydrolase domain-containing protein [Aureibaculum luteum]|uniref:serine hydrolase domain-containing protein n=1 Tax=Aureibaculum luteum TaxID=1548456 RepID=UPI000E4DBA21|nr:serine hydrolase domain-containing protein [Aureibaculum luteum]